MQVIDTMWHQGPGFLSIAGGIFMFFIGMIIFAVFVAVSFFLVRFLLVATTAAQLYVAKNEPVQPAKTTTTPAAYARASGSAVEEPTPKKADSMSAAKASTPATISSPVNTPVKATSTIVAPVKVTPAKVAPAKAPPAKTLANPAVKAAANPAAAVKAPAKPAASVPRTPKSPKSPTTRTAPKKP